MAIFTNQATLTYTGGSANSNIAVGEIIEVLSADKTAVEGSYAPGELVTYVVTIRNTGTGAFTGLTVTDDLGGYEFNGTTVYPLTYEAGSAALFVDGVPQAAPAVTAPEAAVLMAEAWAASPRTQVRPSRVCSVTCVLTRSR